MNKDNPDPISSFGSIANTKVLPQSKVRTSMDAVMREFSAFDPFSGYDFCGHTDQAWACAMTSDNTTLFSGAGDHLIKMWDMETKRLICNLEGHTDCVYCLEVTPDDKYLISCGWDFKIYVWDIENRQLKGTLGTHTNQIFALWVSKDGNHVVTGGRDSYARIWDFQTMSKLGEMYCGGDSVFGLTATSDKTDVITVDGTSSIRIFNFNTYESVSVHPTNCGVPQCIAITNDKKYLIFGTRNFHVKVWKYADKTEFHSFSTHIHWVRGVIVTDDNSYIISGSADKTIRLFNIAAKTEDLKLTAGGFVNAVYLSKDGQYLLASSTDKIMRMWKLGILSRTKQMTGHTNTVISLVISSDDTYIITGSEDCTVRVWSMLDFTEVCCLNGHSQGVWCVAISNDMKTIASGAADSLIILWDFEKKLERLRLTAPLTIYTVSISNDNKYLASAGNDMKVLLWDLQIGTLISTLEGHTDTVFTLKFTYDSTQIISGAADYTLRIWNIQELVAGQKVDTDLLNGDPIDFTTQKSTVFDSVNSQKIDTESGMIESLALSVDERFLVFGDRNNNVELWDWKKKRLIKRFIYHTNWVKAVHFSPNGKLFMSCASDLTVRLWNAEEQRAEYVFKGHADYVRCGAFSNNGKYLITSGNDKIIKFWDIQNIGDMELADIGNSFDTVVYLSKIKKKINPDKSMIDLVFGKLKINALHFYAYLGYHKLLEEALDIGADIRVDEDGNSPLFYALDRKSQDCVDCILQFMIKLNDIDINRFLNYGYALRNDFDLLLNNGSELLPDFLEAIFYKLSNAISFAVPKVSLPCLIYTEADELNPYDFVFKRTELEEITGEVPVQFKALPFPICYQKGSSGSLALLKCILNCSNSLVLETEVVATFIKNKWDDLWYFILLITVLQWANLILMIILIIPSDNTSLPNHYTGVAAGFVIVNLLLLNYEIVQMFATGWSYFRDWWNLLDIARLTLCFTWIVLIYENNDSYLRYIACGMVSANSFRGLSGFKAFDETRYYTKLILRAIGDIVPFLLVFFYSTLSFGVLYYASTLYHGTTIDSLWKWSYELNIGSFNNQGIDKLNYFCFMLASIANVIVILNLLISILGNSFDSFQTDSGQIDIYEMGDLIIELETLMFWNRNKNEKRYFNKCEDLSSLKAANWEGKIKTIMNSINEMRGDIKDNFDRIHKSNAEILMKLNK